MVEFIIAINRLKSTIMIKISYRISNPVAKTFLIPVPVKERLIILFDLKNPKRKILFLKTYRKNSTILQLNRITIFC